MRKAFIDVCKRAEGPTLKRLLPQWFNNGLLAEQAVLKYRSNE